MTTPKADGRPMADRQQLLILGVGSAVIGGGTWWLFGPRIPSVVLLLLATVALAGVVAHRVIGRSVFLIFSLLALAIGQVVSWCIVLLMYVVVIAGLGSVFRLFGMNRLERNFRRCQQKRSMLTDVLSLDPASFRRQS